MTDFQGDRCETCRFWLRKDQDDAVDGLCRRNPPHPLTLFVKPKPREHKKPQEFDYHVIYLFPSMLPSGWCGEHEEGVQK